MTRKCERMIEEKEPADSVRVVSYPAPSFEGKSVKICSWNIRGGNDGKSVIKLISFLRRKIMGSRFFRRQNW